MDKRTLLYKFLVTCALLTIKPLYAQQPLWSFTPLTPTTITVPASSMTAIKYQVTNHSNRRHLLLMRSLNGISQVTTAGNCSNPVVLGSQQSCILNLNVNGSAISTNIVGGPVLCDHGNPNQCYQPSLVNSLRISKAPAAAYTVGGTISGLSSTVVLQNNGSDNLSLSNNGNFTFLTPIAEGSTYNVTVLTQPVAQTCTVTNGSGTMGGSNVTNVSLSCVTHTTTLSISINKLALSVTGLTEYGVIGTPSSGSARVITITNTGSSTATNLAVTFPTWPSGTISSTSCGSSLAASDSCTVTITPGSTATSDGTNPCSVGTIPVAGIVQVSASNTNSVSTDVLILNYGCIYQSGYIFAFDDTQGCSGSTCTGSVGGKVAALSDQTTSAGIVWDSSAGCVNSPYNNCFVTAADSLINGSNVPGGNTYLIYQMLTTQHGELATSYAAGLCTATIAGYSDWYLPALCEMGYSINCGTMSAPSLQNMQSNLVNNSDLAGLNTGGSATFPGIYWSSLENQVQPTIFAYEQSFQAAAAGASAKGQLAFGVRCIRVLTP
jgi:hypothetical protein